MMVGPCEDMLHCIFLVCHVRVVDHSSRVACMYEEPGVHVSDRDETMEVD